MRCGRQSAAAEILRRFRGRGGALVEQPRAQYVGRFRVYSGMQPAHVAERRRAGRRREMSSRVAAQEPEGAAGREAVPQLLEAMNGVEIPFLGKELDELAVDTDPIRRRTVESG